MDFLYGKFLCLGFSDIRCRCLKNEKDLQGFNAFGWIPFNESAADIAGVGFKTEPTTQHQIGGVRLSETKGAHKSQTLIIVVARTVSSRECWMGGQPKMDCRLRYFEESEGFRGKGTLASRVPESKAQP